MTAQNYARTEPYTAQLPTMTAHIVGIYNSGEEPRIYEFEKRFPVKEQRLHTIQVDGKLYSIPLNPKEKSLIQKEDREITDVIPKGINTAILGTYKNSTILYFRKDTEKSEHIDPFVKFFQDTYELPLSEPMRRAERWIPKGRGIMIVTPITDITDRLGQTQITGGN